MTIDNDYKRRLTEKVRDITGRRFCSSCQTHKAPEGGKLIKTSGTRRWKCSSCLAKARKPSGVTYE